MCSNFPASNLRLIRSFKLSSHAWPTRNAGDQSEASCHRQVPATCRSGTGGSHMKTYGMVLAALAVVILGGKFLHAGWSGSNQPKTESVAQATADAESEREMLIRWQQNRATHWRG